MSTQIPKRVLTIAGSDSGGSAGLQADLKTFEALGVFGMSAVTLVTAQNTQGVQAAHPLPEAFINQQIQAVLSDIGADALKTGLLGRESVIQLVVENLAQFSIQHVVVDPVLVNGKGQAIVSPETIQAYQHDLIPRATIITPNLDEAGILADLPIQTEADLQQAAQKLYDLGVQYVLIKGGHLNTPNHITDWLFDGKQLIKFTAPRLPIQNPHGVGCTLAAAIAAELAKGVPPAEAVHHAHQYLQLGLAGSLKRQIGTGRQPVYHGVLTNRDRDV